METKKKDEQTDFLATLWKLGYPLADVVGKVCSSRCGDDGDCYARDSTCVVPQNPSELAHCRPPQ